MFDTEMREASEVQIGHTAGYNSSAQIILTYSQESLKNNCLCPRGSHSDMSFYLHSERERLKRGEEIMK